MDSSSPPFILFSPPVDEWWANGQACREKHHYQESPVYGPDRCLDLCMQCTYTYFKSNPSVPRPKGLSFDSYLHEYKYKPTPDQVLTSADLGCTGCRFIYEAVTKSLTPKEQEGGGHLELSKYEKYVLEWHANDSHYCDIELFACPGETSMSPPNINIGVIMIVTDVCRHHPQQSIAPQFSCLSDQVALGVWIHMPRGY